MSAMPAQAHADCRRPRRFWSVAIGLGLAAVAVTPAAAQDLQWSAATLSPSPAATATAAPVQDPGNPAAKSSVLDQQVVTVAPVWTLIDAERNTTIVVPGVAGPVEGAFPCESVAQSGLFQGAVPWDHGRRCWQACWQGFGPVFWGTCVAIMATLVLIVLAVQKAREARNSERVEPWAVYLELLHRLLLQVPMAAGLFLFVTLAAPPFVQRLDIHTPAVCMKALSAFLFGWMPFGCLIPVVVGLLHLAISEVIALKGRAEPSEEYQRKRPLVSDGPHDDAKGWLFGREVSATTEAKWALFRNRLLLQGSMAAVVAVIFNLLRTGQPFLAFVLACGLEKCVGRSSQFLQLNRLGRGRATSVRCLFQSDAAALLRMSSELLHPCHELLMKRALEASTEGTALLFVSVILLVGTSLLGPTDLALFFLSALLALAAVVDGIGEAREVFAAELPRDAAGQQEMPRASPDRSPQHARANSEPQLLRPKSVDEAAPPVHMLIRFQDYTARKALVLRRAQFATLLRLCEVLPVAVGLGLWCRDGRLIPAYIFGASLTFLWEILFNEEAAAPDLLGVISKRQMLEPLMWPVYTVACPVYLTDPTRHRSERDAQTSGMQLLLWCGVRGTYIMLLWAHVFVVARALPPAPYFHHVADLLDFTQIQRLLAWLWILAGLVAALAFPAVAWRVHLRREAWSREDWARATQQEAECQAAVADIFAVPALYPEWSREEHLALAEEMKVAGHTAWGAWVGSRFARLLPVRWVELGAKLHVEIHALVGDIRALMRHGNEAASQSHWSHRSMASTYTSSTKEPQDLSASKPVTASSCQELAHLLVDGTDSAWTTDAFEPQHIDVDLRQPCYVEEVRVHWWGDYGSRTDLRLLSRNRGAEFELRGWREVDAPQDGWTHLPGWPEPARVVRLELSNPSPDCFGEGKQYGLRGVQVLGRPEEHHGADLEASHSPQRLLSSMFDLNGDGRVSMAEITQFRESQGHHPAAPPHLCPGLVRPDKAEQYQVVLAALHDPTRHEFDIYGAEWIRSVHVKRLQGVLRNEASGCRRFTMYSVGNEVGGQGDHVRVPRISVTTQAGKPGELLIFSATDGGYYGILERQGPGEAVLKHGSHSVLHLHIGNHDDLNMSARANDGTPLALAGRGSHDLGALFWNFRCKPGVDSVLLLTCMLSMVFLQHHAEHHADHDW